jgi:hypothetical protein
VASIFALPFYPLTLSFLKNTRVARAKYFVNFGEADPRPEVGRAADAPGGCVAGRGTMTIRRTYRVRIATTTNPRIVITTLVFGWCVRVCPLGRCLREQRDGWVRCGAGNRPAPPVPRSHLNRPTHAPMPVSVLTFYTFSAPGAWKRGSNCPGGIRRQSIFMTSWFPPAIAGPESVSENSKGSFSASFGVNPASAGLA